MDITVEGVLATWGTFVTLKRSPSVSIEAAPRTPTLYDNLGGQSIPDYDYELLVRSADILPIAIQTGEQIQIGAILYTVIALRPDDGAGTLIQLRRFS